MAPRTILFQPPNRIGLGHISRLLAIALAVKEAAPDTRLPFIVEGEGHDLIEAYGFPQFNLPTFHDLYRTERWAGWDPSDRHLLMIDVVAAAMRTLSPDLIVFDTLPNRGVVSVAVDQGIPVALCLRKMQQTGDYFETVKRYLSIVRLLVIPHDEHAAYAVPPEWRSRALFTGPIVRPSPPGTRGAPRTRARRLVITGGGGGYPGTVEFYNLAVQAVGRVRAKDPSLEVMLVTGPLFREWSDLQLADGIRIIPFDPGLSQTFLTADVVLCQAGYNTVAELLALGVRSIAVPALRVFDDQFERAVASARESPTFEAYRGADPGELAGLIANALQQPAMGPRAVELPPGARRAALNLLNILTPN